MDILQIAIVFLIIIVAILLSITGFFVFLILRRLKRAMDKFEHIVGDVAGMTEETKKTLHVIGGVPGAVGAGVKIAKTIASKRKKSDKKIFKVTKKW